MPREDRAKSPMLPIGSTIAWRLALWFLLLSVLPIAVMIVFVRHSVTDAFTRMAADRARAEAALVARALAEGPESAADGARATADAYGQRERDLLAAASGDHSAALLYGLDGRLLSGRAHGSGTDAALAELPREVAASVRAGGSGDRVDPQTGRVFGWAPLADGRGTVVIARAIEPVDAPLPRMERDALAQLAVSLLIVAVAGAIAIWMVIGPIRRITSAAESIGSGHLDVTIEGEDLEGELGVLTRAFNQMAERLRESYAMLEGQVEERTRELDTLNRVSAAVGRSMDSEAMLSEALSTVLSQLDYDGGAVCTFDRQERRLTLSRCEGFPDEFCTLAPWEATALQAASSAEPIVLQGGMGPPELLVPAARSYRLSAFVPLGARGEVEGVLVLAHRTRDALAPTERELLASVGHQIGVGLQNARLQGRATRVAVLEERQRLARELHDSVTQSLYGVSLFGEAAARLLCAGDVEQGTRFVGQACQTAQAALQEMRLLIFELRPAVLEEIGLAGALQARLEQVELRAGIRGELVADADLDLAAPVEEELYRIAQEALNNALKHAHARSVRVVIGRAPSGAIFLEVRDDGLGMDVESARRRGGIGLHTMAERVELLGGTLSLQSECGTGTTVRVDVPPPGPPARSGSLT